MDADLLLVCGSALAGLLIVTRAALHAWAGWLQLKTLQLSAPAAAETPASRIGAADLRERVRKLEAIAAGIDV